MSVNQPANEVRTQEDLTFGGYGMSVAAWWKGGRVGWMARVGDRRAKRHTVPGPPLL